MSEIGQNPSISQNQGGDRRLQADLRRRKNRQAKGYSRLPVAWRSKRTPGNPPGSLGSGHYFLMAATASVSLSKSALSRSASAFFVSRSRRNSKNGSESRALGPSAASMP